jgi:hypothetical protein
MSLKSFRNVEVPQSEKELSQKTAAASTLQELINTVPQAYRVQIGDYLTKKYRVAHKHANVESTVTQYQRHKIDKSLPPVVRNSLKVPKLQFAKEYRSHPSGMAADETFLRAVDIARTSVLDAAINGKKEELEVLADLIVADEKDWSRRVSLVAQQVANSNGGTIAQDAMSKRFTAEGLPEAAVKELETLAGACGIYTYRCLSIARASIDRTDLQKLSKLSIKKSTDHEMTDAPTRDQAVADLVKEQMESLKKELLSKLGTSSAEKRMGEPLINHRDKKRKVQPFGPKIFSPKEEKSEEEWRTEEKRTEVTLGHYLHCSSKEFRPWLSDTFPHMYLELDDRNRNKITVAFMREWEADSTRAAKPGIFKQDDLIIPEDIEYMLSVNHKYILHTVPQEHDVTLARDAFARSVRIRWQFRNSHNKEFIPRFHVPNPNWQPQKASTAIELGIEEAVEEIDHQVGQALLRAASNAPRHRNMNWTRVQDFLNENQLLVKLTDKNLGLAAFKKNWYISQINKMLEDGQTYKKSSPSDTEQLHEMLVEKLDKWKLPPAMDKFVREKTTSTIPTFHAIPKVHKNPWTLRPIVPSHSWVTSCLSQVVDHICRPILARLPWVVNSTKEVINQLEKISTNSENIWICTGDVVAFYTNINSKDCARVVAGAYQLYFPKSKIPTRHLAQMITFVMDNNYFSFQEQVWKQIGGLAMGTSCAPVLANIYAAFYERHKIVNAKGVLLYVRYIDDILCIFKGTEKARMAFQQKCKLGSLTITWDCSETENEFLDLEILRIQNQLGSFLVTRLFRKPMNKFLYIPWSSAHPLHVKKAFVKAELTRFVMVSSEVGYFAESRRQFYGNLRRRGYPPQILENWFTQVDYSQRRIILDNLVQEDDIAPLMLTGQYNPVWEYINVNEIIMKARRAWNLEKELPETLEQPLIRSLRKSTSLGDMLSVWNKTMLHPTMVMSENLGRPDWRVPFRAGSAVGSRRALF